MKLYFFVLKALRRIYSKFFKLNIPERPFVDPSIENTANNIYKLLMSDKPCMIARFGSVEINAVTNYLGVVRKMRNPLIFIGGGLQWWWNEKAIKEMQSNAGFFPANPEMVSRFALLMLKDMGELDFLASWNPVEGFVNEYIPSVCKRSWLTHLEPFWASEPWSRALKGKRVVVVHPFKETIETQYDKRELLFDKSDVLPEFKTLRVIKAVQSIGGVDNGFKDWFEALDWMKSELDKEIYDIALIGCGAYGFPLAAHVKRTGHKAVHLGGALQLLFGIKGKRWEDPNYGIGTAGYNGYNKLINHEGWIFPLPENKPTNAASVEGGCYW